MMPPKGAIEVALERLAAASTAQPLVARAVAYKAAIDGLSGQQMVHVIAVLTEGAMLGPVHARVLAGQLGG